MMMVAAKGAATSKRPVHLKIAFISPPALLRRHDPAVFCEPLRFLEASLRKQPKRVAPIRLPAKYELASLKATQRAVKIAFLVRKPLSVWTIAPIIHVLHPAVIVDLSAFVIRAPPDGNPMRPVAAPSASTSCTALRRLRLLARLHAALALSRGTFFIT
jgi:hypothetical protein